MKTSVAKSDFTKYLAEARSWETDSIKQAAKLARIAWYVAGVSALIALSAVISVAVLTPLKTVVPYVIRVDNSTGSVDVMQSMTNSQTTYDEVMNKYFVQRYVRFREGYSNELAEEFYQNVGILSSSTEQQKYLKLFAPTNPLSPLNLYGPFVKVRITAKSISFIKSDVALIRYTREIDKNGEHPELSHWAATIVFKYNPAPMTEKQRALNPLGFQVLEYRNDPDAATIDGTVTAVPVALPPVPPQTTVVPTTPLTVPGVQP